MTDDFLSDELKSLFLEDLFKDNFTYSNHSFSLRYKCRKRRTLNKFAQEHQNKVSQAEVCRYEHMRLPIKYLLLIGILLVLALLGFTIYRNYSGLILREFDTHSLMFGESDPNAPETLTEKFYLDLDIGDYEQQVIADNEITRLIKYKLNGETQFYIEQQTISGSVSRLNTENAVIKPQNITVNGWDGMYFQAYDGWYIYFFDLGDYTISYGCSCNLNKNIIEELVKGTKFKKL